MVHGPTNCLRQNRHLFAFQIDFFSVAFLLVQKKTPGCIDLSADKFRQISVLQQLAHGLHLTAVIPVMVDNPLYHTADIAGLFIPRKPHRFFQILSCKPG